LRKYGNAFALQDFLEKSIPPNLRRGKGYRMRPRLKKPIPAYKWLDVATGEILDVEPAQGDTEPLSQSRAAKLEPYAPPLRLCALYWLEYSENRKYTVFQAALAKHAFFACFVMVLPE